MYVVVEVEGEVFGIVCVFRGEIKMKCYMGFFCIWFILKV